MNKNKYDHIRSKVWFKLMLDGSLKFYNSIDILEQYVNSLEELGFNIYHFNCNNWIDINSFDKEYFECLDIKRGEEYHKVFPEGMGNLFILRNFDEFFKNSIKDALEGIQLLNKLSWQYLLFNKRLIVCLQSNDLNINNKIMDLGETPIRWIDNI